MAASTIATQNMASEPLRRSFDLRRPLALHTMDTQFSTTFCRIVDPVSLQRAECSGYCVLVCMGSFIFSPHGRSSRPPRAPRTGARGRLVQP